MLLLTPNLSSSSLSVSTIACAFVEWNAFRSRNSFAKKETPSSVMMLVLFCFFLELKQFEMHFRQLYLSAQLSVIRTLIYMQVLPD